MWLPDWIIKLLPHKPHVINAEVESIKHSLEKRRLYYICNIGFALPLSLTERKKRRSSGMIHRTIKFPSWRYYGFKVFKPHGYMMISCIELFPGSNTWNGKPIVLNITPLF
jgi:hypothetical protein